METHGRPTPQVESRRPSDFKGGDQNKADTRPRFKDRLPEEAVNPDANPFFKSHRTFGRPLLPATEAWPLRGQWAQEFKREAPLYLEIGCGNGFFLEELARSQPEVNIIGIEIRFKRTVLCAKKLVKAKVTNARIARYHAAFLDDLFLPHSLDGIFVNHPDPWPKERHEKNRLISRWFLEDVTRLLKPGGFFRLKSDFHPNVDRVQGLLNADGDGSALPQLPLDIRGLTHDLDNEGAPWQGDIETHYQRKMRAKGEKIAGIELIRR